jgi:hypothetical protein
MRVSGAIYTVHEHADAPEPSDRIILLREGFAFWAFAFHFMWLLANRCWRMAAVYIVLMVALEGAGSELGLSEISLFLLQFGLQVWLGCTARDIQRAQLERRGYREIEIVCAESELLAERRFFDRRVAA